MAEVLLVEDEKNLAALFEDLLTRRGHSVVVCTTLASAAKNGLLFTSSQLANGMIFSPIWVMWPRMTMPNCSASHFLAIAPAATRTAVSRADERPPPRGSRMPYLCQ